LPFLNSVRIDQFTNSLNVQVPSKEKFLQLSHIFPIYPKMESNPIINYERGILLYSLIAKYKPKNVLEFGTAEGYSALCMAWAMVDYDIRDELYIDLNLKLIVIIRYFFHITPLTPNN